MSSVRGIEDLGDYLTLDIFSRLDVRAIIYCKCVCKTWRELVLDPYLVNSLWSKNKKTPSLMIHDVKLSKRGDLYWIEIQEQEEDQEFLDTERIHNVDLYAPGVIKGYPGFSNTITRVGGSIDGLICLWDVFGGTWIINPVTKECMTLPEAHSSLTYTNLGVISYGFGVSKGGNEYKVIRICDLNATGIETQVEIEVYTLGTNLGWRILQPQDHYNNVCDYMTSGLFCDGHLHWINVNGSCELFVFELGKETFDLFPSPPPVYEFQEEKIGDSALGVLKGCLSQYCWYPFKQCSVWVMKEYGIKNSWYKAFTIKETNIAHLLAYPLRLIDGPKGGLLIVKVGEKLAAYCLQTNTLKRVNLSSRHPHCRVCIETAVTYRPNFLKLQNFASPDAVVHAF